MSKLEKILKVVVPLTLLAGVIYIGYDIYKYIKGYVRPTDPKYLDKLRGAGL